MATATHKIDLGKAVAAYGSLTALATRLDLHLSTVHGWHRRKRIPPWRVKEIAAIAAEDGFDVTKKSRRRSVR